MVYYYSARHKNCFATAGHSTILLCVTRFTRTILTLHLFITPLLFGERVLRNEYSLQHNKIDRIKLLDEHVVCPDLCSCSKETPNSVQVQCSRANYTDIPPGIPNKVTNLDLSQNLIAVLRARSFSRFANLRILSLSSNIIRYIDVNAFAGLINLNTLSLTENPIRSSGLVDFIFSSLRSLTDLQLRSCEFESINIKAFLNLTKLGSLDVRSNNLTSVPELIYNGRQVFPNLKTLRLDYNQIQSFSLKYISSMSNLEFINLIGNKISEMCPPPYVPNQFKTMRHDDAGLIISNSSKYFRASFGNVSYKDVSIGQQSDNVEHSRRVSHSKLTKLFLSSNIIRVLSENCFSDVTLLQKLAIASNRITRIDPLAFKGLVFLNELILAGNSMLVYEDFVFSPASSLKIIDMEHAQMTTFNVKAFFNLTDLHILILTNNSFSYIPNFATGDVAVIPNLRTLQMAYNKIVTLTGPAPAHDVKQYTGAACNIIELQLDHNLITHLAANSFTRFPSLRKLTLTFNFITTIHPATFTGLQNLNNLDISQNPIKILLDGIFSPLPALSCLYMTNSELGKPLNVRAFLNLTNLQDLRLDYNKLEDIPIFVERNVSILPNLSSLSMSTNNLQSATLLGLTSLPNLQTIALDNNDLTLRPGILERLPNLRELRLANCHIVFNRKGLRSTSLTHLIMNGSFITFLYPETFQDASMLRILHMAKCKRSDFLKKPQTFRNMVNLEIVDLSETGIILNKNTFTNSTKIKYLNLNGNSVDNLDRRVFNEMKNLQSLHLRSTNLISVNYSSLPMNVWNKLTVIDFSMNPYSCECDIVWFHRWLQKTKTTILNKNAYICQYPAVRRGAHIQALVDPSNLACFQFGIDWYRVSVILFLVVVCISSLLVSLLYRFRWHVRYWQSLLLTTRRRYREILDQREYQYDAFVMYSQNDAHWVIHELRPHLENKEHLRLCIHQRDWLAGQDITDNITDSIETSRKCLLIVSNAFAASQWCHFELTMAQSRLFQEDRDNLVLVMLEEISECHVTPRLRLQMQRQTYIEWTDNVLGQHIFWSRLTRALRGPDLSVINSPLPQSIFVAASPHENTEE